MRTSLCIALVCAACGCRGVELLERSEQNRDVSAYSELTRDTARMRASCVNRVNEATDVANDGRRWAYGWRVGLGVLAAIASAYALLAAEKKVATRLKLKAGLPFVAAGTAAAALVLQPFATTSDHATQVATEHDELVDDLARGDSESDSRERLRAYTECAAGHGRFVVPGRQLPTGDSPPEARDELPSTTGPSSNPRGADAAVRVDPVAD